MIAREFVDGKDSPMRWRLEHSSGLWVAALVSEALVAEGLNSRQWQSSRMALQHLQETEKQRDLVLFQGLDVAKEPSGKPFARDAEGRVVPVALAHTSGMGAAALPRTRDIAGIGVDIERLSERFLRVWPRIASPEDWNHVIAVVNDGQEDLAAALIWVVKEASYKAAFNQQSLFGHHQILHSIKQVPCTAGLRWVGQIHCKNSNPVEITDFEAGMLSVSSGPGPQEVAQGAGVRPWLWSVAWLSSLA